MKMIEGDSNVLHLFVLRIHWIPAFSTNDHID